MPQRHLTANDTPGRHAPSWYAETAGPCPEHAQLQGETRADVCIVGGGYAGLSAALHLADAGYDVVLVEANRLGWGASGRNGGQLGLGPRADIRAYEDAVGRADARKVWDLALAANRLVRDLVHRFSMDVDLANGGLEVAWRKRDAEHIAALDEHLRRHYGFQGMATLTRSQVEGMLATRRYHGGGYWQQAGHLHPLRFALGLAQAAADAGARLRERSRAVRVRHDRVDTVEGSVRARHVLIAANGYLDGLVSAVAARSMPINNFIIATQPLGRERAERLIAGSFAVHDTKFVVDYFRLTRDHRLLWGGGESYGARFPSDIAGLVRGKMLRVFPQLADVAITHAWGGTLAITRSRFPAFQRLEGGMLAVSGWSGSGVHMATFAGKLAAEAIMGRAERFDTLAAMPAPPFPGGAWLRAPLLAAAMTWYSLRDRL
ncbi:MAG: FAD-binding oxidoreductase [Pseudomonadota bacterium]